MVMLTDPLYPACGEEEETVLHFLGRCNSTMMVRNSVFGKYLMETEESHKVKLISLLWLVRNSH